MARAGIDHAARRSALSRHVSDPHGRDAELGHRARGRTHRRGLPEGSVFMREELKEQERQQVETLAKRLQSDLALLALQGAQTEGPARRNARGRSVAAAQLRTADADRAPRHRSRSGSARTGQRGRHRTARRRPGARAPLLKPYVTVIGEVQNATSHVWKSDLSRDDYVGLSGGTTQRADDDRIYVVRANGSVVAERA